MMDSLEEAYPEVNRGLPVFPFSFHTTCLLILDAGPLYSIYLRREQKFTAYFKNELLTAKHVFSVFLKIVSIDTVSLCVCFTCSTFSVFTIMTEVKQRGREREGQGFQHPPYGRFFPVT